MKYSEVEIELARQLRQHGLAWEPAAGQYVWDETGVLSDDEPLQSHVHFVLDYDAIMHSVGGVQQFKQRVIWLPTWEEARELLRLFDVADADVAEQLRATHAIELGTERAVLYEMILASLESNTAAAAAMVT